MNERIESLIERLVSVIEISKRMYNQPCVRVNQMLKTHGPVETCIILINKKEPPTGLIAMLEARRPDLTIEAIVLDYPDLFSKNDLRIARNRLP